MKGTEQTRLFENLYQRYVKTTGVKNRFIYLRKKYTWLIIIGSTKLLKRMMDIVVSTILLVILSPLMLFIASLIKITDGGPILYVTNRVSKWGREFRFPKFRSMKIKADLMKNELLQYNEYKSNVTFKMKNDPRTTWIGKTLRMTSLDELPQLWCVLLGNMSLVGPRPPLPEEVALYTLQERRRLDIIPGLTCFWQVSGRSELPFSKQVKLDLQYIESQSFWLDLKLLLKTIPAVLSGIGAY